MTTQKGDTWPFEKINATPEELARSLFPRSDGSHPDKDKQSESGKEQRKKRKRLRSLFSRKQALASARWRSPLVSSGVTTMKA